MDLVVCSALGADMYDCVYPTRTAVSQSVGNSQTELLITFHKGYIQTSDIEGGT